MKINDGGPAYPVECTWDRETGRPLDGVQTGSFSGWQTGLSVRDWFAGQALTGIVLREEYRGNVDAMSNVSYMIADAMLKARETPND